MNFLIAWFFCILMALLSFPVKIVTYCYNGDIIPFCIVIGFSIFMFILAYAERKSTKPEDKNLDNPF